MTYVAEVGSSSNAICALEMPCQTLTQAFQPTALRKYVKVTGIITDGATVDIVSKKAIIYGEPGAQLRRSPAETVLRIRGTSEVTIVDLDVQGNAAVGGKHCVEITDDAVVTMMGVNVHNHGQSGIALAMRAKLVMLDSQVHDNTMEGVIATGGTLELRRSLIYKNQGVAGVSAMNSVKVTIDSSMIAANTGSSGGVSITGPFSIKNSIISANGSLTMTSSAGGLTLNPVNAANAEFEFNTVSDNLSASSTTGINCSNVSFDVSNSIFTSVLATGNVVNNCNVKYSLTGLSGTATGTNKVGDPMFITKELLSPMFYRIGSMSTARDSADPAATLDVDIDNQLRSDAQRDMGADEFR
ncbi:MAG TPA: right-handed parallel beta-helix repeat-containing protein [Kofleriaceae bacterium]|nr:right-handed parallel beta-helix repeat-containing protein [Kofleriaceae bacterium]